MTIELRPLGVRCNIQCQYCYQNPLRDAGNVAKEYDLDKMLEVVEQEGDRFALFGGEPLLLPLEDLERLWAWGFQRYGSNSVQTNGALIRREHIDLFRKYNVRVGISIDGPEELNDARWAGSLERTRKTTAQIHAVIRQLCEEGMPPGLIITLHRGNAVGQRLARMNAWIRELEEIGVRSIMLHILEVDHEEIARQYELTTGENLVAFRNFAALARELTTLRIRIFDEMRDLLLGNDEKADCVWNACDPYTTRAVRGIEGNGQRSNCGRVNKEGIEFTKGDVEGFERYLALYSTPQEEGGCQGCRFFLMCKGQCPGTAAHGDWRNRTQYCEVWMHLFEECESQLISEGKTPLSVHPSREALEKVLLEHWMEGRPIRLVDACKQVGVTAVPAPGGTPVTDEVVAPSPVCRDEVRRDGLGLPDFARVVWVSDEAKGVWAPRLRRLRAVWPQVEIVTVADGVRRCATVRVDADQTETMASLIRSRDLAVQTVTGERIDVRSDWRPGVYVVGRDADLAEFEEARRAADSRALGQMMGHPVCCQAFLQRVWKEGNQQDATWQAALASGSNESPGRVQVEGPPQANPLLRSIGVHAVPHHPCRFDCQETVALADRFLDSAEQGGYATEVAWLLEMLSWPAEWSARFGIAEIRIPVLKISTRAAATPTERVVQRRSEAYPAEGAQGVHFPYVRENRRLFTLSTSYRRGLEHARRQHASVRSEPSISTDESANHDSP